MSESISLYLKKNNSKIRMVIMNTFIRIYCTGIRMNDIFLIIRLDMAFTYENKILKCPFPSINRHRTKVRQVSLLVQVINKNKFRI